MSWWSYIIIFFSLLVLSGLFSGTETAFFSLNLLKKKKVARLNRGEIAAKLLNKPHDLLITILIGNTFINVAIASISDLYFETRWGTRGFLVSVFFTTFFLLLMGEIVPKILAINLQEFFTLSSARFIHLFYHLVSPLVNVLKKLNSRLLSVISKSELTAEKNITREEFKSFLIRESIRKTSIEPEKSIIDRILQFGESAVSSIKVPRTQMVCVSEQAGLNDILAVIKDTGYSRIPIYQHDLDNISGIVFAKDLIPYVLSQKTFYGLETLLRPATFIPEQKKASALFQEMTKLKQQLVITIDEFGGVSGLVTLEDLVEEIVGDIYDEWDQVSLTIRPLAPGKTFVKAELTLAQFNDYFGVQYDDGTSLTIGGFLFQKIGHLPQQGEKIVVQNLSFEIENVTHTKIETLIVRNF